MAETAVPLVDPVYPAWPVRPGVLTVHKRLRYWLEFSPRRHRAHHWFSHQRLLDADEARDLLV